MLRYFILIILLISVALPVFAAGLVPCGGEGEKVCELADLFILIKNIMNWLMLYGGIFATLVIAGGGIMMLISRGNPGQITKAKMWITYAVIGLLLIFTAWLIINTIMTVLGYQESIFGKWETIGDETINK
ncbi:MAG: pilin [bacterium]